MDDMSSTAVIVLVLVAVIQIILILSVVHISSKQNEISARNAKTNELLERIAKILSENSK